MARIKESISGKVISPKTIEVMDAKRSKLIPGQKVLIYQTTGHNIVSASGKVIGKKEKVLGSGEVKIVGDKLVVESPKIASVAPTYKISGTMPGRLKSKSGSVARGMRNRKAASGRTVLIKPIDE